MRTTNAVTSIVLACALTAGCGGTASDSGPTSLGTWTPGGSPMGASGAGASDNGSSGGGSSSAGSGRTSAGGSRSGGATGASASGAGSTSSNASSGSASSSGWGGASSAQGSSGTSSTSGSGGSGGSLPCDVAALLAAKCVACHSDPPVNGSLSGLATYADLTAKAKEDPTKTEAQLSVTRMQSTTSPMPPSSVNLPATSSEIASLQAWVNAGYPGGGCTTDAGTGSDASGPTITVVDVFKGQPGFQSTTAGGTHNAGRDCMGCHSGGGGEAPQFMFGGTLYDANGKGLAGAEVRVVDAQGHGYSVYTGPEGNFHMSGGKLATPAHAGARNTSGPALMISDVTKGGCNSCHCTGTGCTTSHVHLP